MLFLEFSGIKLAFRNFVESIIYKLLFTIFTVILCIRFEEQIDKSGYQDQR